MKQKAKRTKINYCLGFLVILSAAVCSIGGDIYIQSIFTSPDEMSRSVLGALCFDWKFKAWILQGFYYPLIAPSVIPEIKYLFVKK